MLQYSVLLSSHHQPAILALFIFIVCFQTLKLAHAFNSVRYGHEINSRRVLSMKWSFSSSAPKPGSNGGVQDTASLIGVDGEFYFHPARQAKLKSPPEACGKSMIVPIFPYNNIIVPGASESISVFEMKNRQLFNDLQNGMFGMSFYSQQNNKLSLVGILAKITNRKLMEDGRVCAVVEGCQRYYVE